MSRGGYCMRCFISAVRHNLRDFWTRVLATWVATGHYHAEDDSWHADGRGRNDVRTLTSCNGRASFVVDRAVQIECTRQLTMWIQLVSNHKLSKCP